jgi:hypothetical protein
VQEIHHGSKLQVLEHAQHQDVGRDEKCSGRQSGSQSEFEH